MPRVCVQFVVVVFPDNTHLLFLIVKESGFKNVKNKYFGMSPFKQNFHLFYPLVHSISSMKPDIALNLSLANIPVLVCLIRYPSFY